MSVTAYPTLRLKLTMPQALKLQFLPAIPGSNASAAADRAEQAAQDAQNAANTAVAATANKVDKSGDTMSGFLTLNANPTAVLHAATKQYVDAATSTGIADGDKGDLTVSGGGTVWTIDADAVTYAKIQNVSATSRFLGRFSVGAGDVQEGTGTQATSLLDVFTSTLKGLAPLSGGGTANFLRADGSWATPPGGGGTGNVSNSGTPAVGQVALWTDATHIQGISSTADQTTARSNIYAAPLDALAYNGMQINGSMEVSQENGTTAVVLSTGTAAYVIDTWQAKFVRAATLAISCQQVIPPGSPSFQSSFQNALQIKATTGLGSLATGDYGFLEQTIEGYRVSRLGFGSSAAASVTIGFWVYATIAGTMTMTLLNSASTRAIPVNVVINSATTWEYKTVTIAGDTSGTWLFTNGTGLRVRFCFGAGSTFQGTNNTWVGSEVFATSSTTNFFANTNNLACITGVVVLPGTEAPSAARSPFIMRPFAQELMVCKRYLEYIVVNIQAPSPIASAAFSTGATYSIEKRSTPTMTVTSTVTFTGNVASRTATAVGTIGIWYNIAASAGANTDTFDVGRVVKADARL